MLKNFKINICNDENLWEFEHKSQITEISSYQFAKKISAITCVFKVHTVYWSACQPCEDTDLWDNNNDNTASADLINVSEWLSQKYQDFFNIWNADRLASHKATDHAIKLKPGSELSYMRTYNMSSAELKTLDEYINEMLTKN